LDRAIKLYTRALDQDPRMAIGYFNRAAAYRSRNKIKEALDDFDKAVEHDPRMAPAYYGRGEILLQRDDFNLALRDMNRALELDPLYEQAHSSKGRALIALNKPQEAILSLNEAIKLDPDDGRAFLFRGLAHKKAGDRDTAEQDLKSAIDLDPGLAQAWYELGNLEHASGNKRDAIKSYNAAIQLKPDYANALNNRGWVRASAGDLSGALNDLNRAVKAAPEFLAALKNRAWVNSKLGNTDQTIRDYQRILDLNPDEKSIRIALSKLLLASGKEGSALKGMEQAMANGALDLEGLKLSARTALKAGEYEKAVEFHTRALREASNEPALLMGRAKANMKLQRYDHAIKDMEEALKYKKAEEAAKIHYELGKALLITWKLQEAIEHFNKTLEIDPDNGLALANRGVAHKEIGYLKKAEKDFEEALGLVTMKTRKDKIRKLISEVKKILLGPEIVFKPLCRVDDRSPGLRDSGRNLW
jgi:tetratricopeptide (TPR) repeat protein